MHPMFIAALVIIAKARKQPKCSSADEWIKKMWGEKAKRKEIWLIKEL